MFLTQQFSSINSTQHKALRTTFHWIFRYSKDFWKQTDWILVDSTDDWLIPDGQRWQQGLWQSGSNL